MKKRALNSDSNQDEINEPFPLLGLPYELLEEIATWFTQREAVKVLTVNKVCHEAFSRTVWRVVDSRKALLDLPADTWKRYGSLVRVANFEYHLIEDHITALIPNIRLMNIGRCPVFEKVPVGEMRNLRKLRVTVYCHDISRHLADINIPTWVKSAQDRCQNVVTEWNFVNIGTVEWKYLVEAIGLISDVSRHSFSISAQSSLTIDGPSLPTKLIQMLVKFDIHQIRHPGVYCDMHSGLFAGGSDGTESSFPRLKILNLAPDFYLSGSGMYTLAGVTPNKFPSLCKLAFIIEIGFTDDDNKMAGFCSHTWWNVTDLLISYQSRTDVMNRILTVFPNTRRFWLHGLGIYTADLQVIAQNLPHLEDLHLVDVVGFSYGNNGEETEIYQISGIKKLVLWIRSGTYSSPLPSSFLRFVINGTPSLETLKLPNCNFRDGVLEQFEGKVNESVRTLVVCVGYFTRVGLAEAMIDQLPQLMGMLPSVEKLALVGHGLNQHSDWKKRYPLIKVSLVSNDIDFYSEVPRCMH
ncbi:hypothetical protein GQ42DRAFT_162606 [Ramicandelaber brevisporus]|nr:hypothetical protein GQ42DRAFT_162606 [Ramicandelaber brevisporus]